MNNAILITAETYQEAWAKVVLNLQSNHWKMWSVMVQIDNPLIYDKEFHNSMNQFAKKYDLKSQECVANTIFPYKLYKQGMNRQDLYRNYWKYFKMFQLNKYSRWGNTYFGRMISYGEKEHNINQLEIIINNIKDRKINYGASYVMLIPCPQSDIRRKMAAPCLNYITVQVDTVPGNRYINMLAVYRNHDFRERAYGNYMGLGKLMEYIAIETDSKVGKLTCVSSRAYVERNKRELINMAGEFLENGRV